MEGRELEPAERTRLARIMRDEDRARAGLDEVLERRDALVRDLRWGNGSRGPVRPEAIRSATRSRSHPDGLGRSTLHRIVGRSRDRAMDDEQET